MWEGGKGERRGRFLGGFGCGFGFWRGLGGGLLCSGVVSYSSGAKRGGGETYKLITTSASTSPSTP